MPTGGSALSRPRRSASARGGLFVRTIANDSRLPAMNQPADRVDQQRDSS
jgi:hypothetical protein